MSLKKKIQENLITALKEKKDYYPPTTLRGEIEVSTLRMLLAAILNKEKEKRYKLSREKTDLEEKELQKESQLTDEEVIEVISSEAKKRKEAISEFEKGERQDLVEKETKEKEILEKYLPEQLSEEEIQKLVKEAIEKTGAKELKDMGKVMAELMPQVKGRAEGGLVSKIVRDSLTPKIE